MEEKKLSSEDFQKIMANCLEAWKNVDRVLSGRLVTSKAFDKGMDEVTVDVRHLPNGLYLVKAVLGSGLQGVSKVVIQH